MTNHRITISTDPAHWPWEQTRDEPNRLYCWVSMIGAEFHAEALAVETDAEGLQSAIDYDDNLTQYHLAAGGDGPFSTITVLGRQWAVFLTPFCE